MSPKKGTSSKEIHLNQSLEFSGGHVKFPGQFMGNKLSTSTGDLCLLICYGGDPMGCKSPWKPTTVWEKLFLLNFSPFASNKQIQGSVAYSRHIAHSMAPFHQGYLRIGSPPVLRQASIFFTPWKINIEPKNHLFEKENHLPNLHYYVPC